MSPTFLATLLLAASLISADAYSTRRFSPLNQRVRENLLNANGPNHVLGKQMAEMKISDAYSPLYVGPQDRLMEADKIDQLPGQPDGTNFDQYAGYITVDASHGRALFYYFVESPENVPRPLVLWLNGGPGCSSIGGGAMMELGPFRVKSDGKTLYPNPYAWNKVANVLFLESPAGVGFSYSNTSSDYDLSGDKRTADDSYTFLVNWLERFPQYKTRDFYITGESYAGHYVPQLAQLILHNNKITNQTVINLKGIAIGNALIDDPTQFEGSYEFYWNHALLSDEIYAGIEINCNPSSNITSVCYTYLNKADNAIGPIYGYNIYYPICSTDSGAASVVEFDPCSEDYIFAYLNLPEVQGALHANVTGLPGPWSNCNNSIHGQWTDWAPTVLPVIQELMASDIRVWIYSGDVDGVVPITTTKLAINTFKPAVKTAWYPWFSQQEVGGYAVGYQNLTFVTVRGSGHFVPSYQPARALTLFSSFLDAKLPPASS